VVASCYNCSEQFRYTCGEDDETSFCSDCATEAQVAKENMVAGTWNIRNDEIRKQMKNIIVETTEYHVFEAERVKRLWVYDPTEDSE